MRRSGSAHHGGCSEPGGVRRGTVGNRRHPDRRRSGPRRGRGRTPAHLRRAARPGRRLAHGLRLEPGRCRRPLRASRSPLRPLALGPAKSVPGRTLPRTVRRSDPLTHRGLRESLREWRRAGVPRRSAVGRTRWRPATQGFGPEPLRLPEPHAGRGDEGSGFVGRGDRFHSGRTGVGSRRQNAGALHQPAPYEPGGRRTRPAPARSGHRRAAAASCFGRSGCLGDPFPERSSGPPRCAQILAGSRHQR